MTDIWHILWRSLLGFVVLMLITRIVGKKQISQLTFFDYVVGITIGNIAGSLSLDIDQIPVDHSLASLALWGGLPIGTALLELKFRWFRKMVDGSPTVVVQQGQIMEDNLRRERMSTDELMHLLREKNAFHVQDVEFAVMETDGKLSVLKKTDSQPITPKTQGIIMEQEREPRLVVIDGQVQDATLAALGLTREWLLGEVRKQGAERCEDVFLAQIDAKGTVYADLYHDHNHRPEMKARPLLAATLKKVQADLELFALQTRVPHARRMYSEQADSLQHIIDTVSPLLKG